MDWTLIISGIITAYLIGSFSSAVLIGKWFFNIDVRQHGSGNAGATNTIRVLGPKIGVIVLLMDVFKGWLAVYLFGLFAPSLEEPSSSYVRLLFAFAVVIGHVFPLYTAFRGGKGVATLLGVGLALFPTAALIVIVWFVIILWIFRYVSLGSITGAILFPVLVNVLLPGPPQTTPMVILSILVGIVIPVTHIKNIKRLIKGEENRFSLSSSSENKPSDLQSSEGKNS